MCESESKCVYVRCGIKRVSGVGQASYGEADVGTYCPGLPHCTPERWTDEQQTAGRGEEKGRKRGKERQGQMRGGKREINRATRFLQSKALSGGEKERRAAFSSDGRIASALISPSRPYRPLHGNVIL